MRLDARKGDWNYKPYDARTGLRMINIVWVDDETNQYGSYIDPGDLDLSTVTNDETKIIISLGLRMIWLFSEPPEEDQYDEQVRESDVADTAL